jgi:hypothetical protein
VSGEDGKSAKAVDILRVLSDMNDPGLEDIRFAVIVGGSSYSLWPFSLGEIIAIGPAGREPWGERRKPSKWPVDVREFETLAEAIDCRNAIRVENLDTAGDFEEPEVTA